jgi:6-phosphogluconolactonase (cycloisomerase 2 family)
VDPKDRFVYVGNRASIDISGYTLNHADGSLTQIVGSPFPAPNVQGDVGGMAIDQKSRFLYVALYSEANDNIAGFAINPVDGSLKPLAGSPFTQPGVAPSTFVTTPF